jgi:SAM-dependent methyltransferase
MKDTFAGGWAKVNELDLDVVTDLIVTGRTTAEAKPDRWLFSFLKDNDKAVTILDFGCGFGRNAFGLAIQHPHWTVIGYDSEQMLSRVPEYAAIHYEGKIPNNLWFVSDWPQLTHHTFDKILCSIVLQHIYEEPLSRYCKDFKKMTKFLFVTGRRYNDDVGKRSTWIILGLCQDIVKFHIPQMATQTNIIQHTTFYETKNLSNW